MNSTRVPGGIAELGSFLHGKLGGTKLSFYVIFLLNKDYGLSALIIHEKLVVAHHLQVNQEQLS